MRICGVLQWRRGLEGAPAGAQLVRGDAERPPERVTDTSTGGQIWLEKIENC